MVKLTKHELQAIHILKNNPDFKIFLDAIGRSATMNAAQSATAKEDVISRWMQGRYQECMDILNVVRDADADLRQLLAAESTRK